MLNRPRSVIENGKNQGFVGGFVVLYSSLLGGWAPSGCTPLKFNSSTLKNGETGRRSGFLLGFCNFSGGRNKWMDQKLLLKTITVFLF